MSGRKSIAVFDVGTTAVKSCLFSEQAELLAISVREYRLDAKGDRVEAQPEQYWEAMCLGMADVLNQLSDAQVEAVGLTTQGETLVPEDAAALAAGSGNGVVTETTGTALVAAAVTRTPVFPREHPVTIYRHAIQGEYVCLPISNTAGMALRWFRDQFCPDLPAGSAGYAALDGMAAAVPPGCEGLIFLPYLSGCVDPDACPQARAMFFGATLAHTRAHFARAVLESTAFVLADFLEMLDKMGCPCRELRSLGGGASSALWQQIKADACGRQMTVPACREATAQGAALLAGRGSGIMPSHFVPTAPPVVCYRPDPTTASLYREARELTHQLYAAVRPLY